MYLVAIMNTIIYLYRPQHLISFRKITIFRKVYNLSFVGGRFDIFG